MNSYKKLESKYKTLYNLEHAISIVGWDEEVNMPVGGGKARADSLAELELISHNIKTDKELESFFKEASELLKKKKLNSWQVSNLNEMKKDWLSNNAIPPELVEELTQTSISSNQAWRKLRSKNDWKSFESYLERVVKAQIKAAQILSNLKGVSPYESLMDDYEPGMTIKQVDKIFNELRKFLPKFIEKVIKNQNKNTVLNPTGFFPIEKQKELGMKMIKVVGFDLNHGRLDTSHHPFCGGVSEDVRMTTRYNENNFYSSLMGILHEAGHGKYEQGLPKKWINQPVGRARSMGVHESQSLLQEMQVCRSKEFINFITPYIKEAFNVNGPEYEPDNLYRYVTKVAKSLIRVDSDEVTYPMHIILRYEIEKDLINGEIKVEDIPCIWNEKMMKYLGLDTKGNYKDGCMQDVHWPSGLFGYFPSYTLGACLAAQLYQKAKQEHPKIPGQIQVGKWNTLNKWLKNHIWEHGCLYSTSDLIVQATGEELNPIHFKNHLVERYDI